MNRTVLLSAILTIYVATLARGPLVRLIERDRFDPLDPLPRAIEQLIVAKQYEKAQPLAVQLHAAYPKEPLVSYWLTRIAEGLKQDAP